MRLKSNIIYENVIKHPARSFIVFVAVVILSSSLFGGLVIATSLQKGMDNMERRLGADLMIVPSECEATAQDMLLEGIRSNFYLDSSAYEKISAVEGIREATPQFFLKSLSADCCSSEVEIVFYDPKTDFLIQPWINESYHNELSNNMAVVGNSIDLSDDSSIKLFGKEYTVAAKLAKTGTSIDNSVYFTFDALPEMLADAKASGVYIPESQRQETQISTVFLNIKDGYKSADILKALHKELDCDFGVVYPKEMATELSGNLFEISGIIKGSVVMLFFISLLIMFFLHFLSMNERKKEIALLRIFGTSKKKALSLLVKESILICLAGSVAGCGISSLFVIPFGNYIGNRLNMPYIGPVVRQVITYMIMTLVITVITGIVVSIYPALHISRMEPYNALRKEGE